MSLQIMASKRRAAALLPPLTSLHSFSSTILFFFLLFLPFCSPISPLLPHPFPSFSFPSTLPLTLFIFTLSTLLSSNVFPVCLTGGYRQKGNLSQGQTDSTNRLLQTVAPTLAAVFRRGILSRYAHVGLISTLERQQKSCLCIYIQHKDVSPFSFSLLCTFLDVGGLCSSSFLQPGVLVLLSFLCSAS